MQNQLVSANQAQIVLFAAFLLATTAALAADPKDCQTIGSTTDCPNIHPHSFCGNATTKAGDFTDGTGCACNWGYVVVQGECVRQGPGPAPGPGPSPAPGAVCRSPGGASVDCPSPDNGCCDGPPGVSCYRKATQECCASGPGKGYVCPLGKCSNRAGFQCL